MQDLLAQAVHVVDPGRHTLDPTWSRGSSLQAVFLHLLPCRGCFPRALDAPCCPPVLREGTSPVERCAGKVGVAKES